MHLFPSPQTHIHTWLRYSILHGAAYLCAVGGETVLEDYRFLPAYLHPLQQQFADGLSFGELDQACQAHMLDEDRALKNRDFPLVRLRRAGLTLAHLRGLLFAGMVEMDARFGTMYSALHPFPDEQRLTVGLLEDLLRFNAVEEPPPAWTLLQDLERRGLLTRHHCDRPRAAQAVSIPAPVWDALCGTVLEHPAAHLTYHPPQSLNGFADLNGLLPTDLLEKLALLPDLVNRQLTQGVILRGMRGTGRWRAIAAVAQAQNRGILYVKRPDVKELPALCRLAGAIAIVQNAVPLIDLELAPGESFTLPELAGYSGLLGILLSREGSLKGPQVERCIILWTKPPDEAARHQQWTQMLNPSLNGTREVIAQASQQYLLTLGAVEQAGRLAQAYAALNDHPHVALTDVQEACRALNQQTLENLATRIDTHGSWNTLIVADKTRAELETLIRRCRYRETLLTHLGQGFAGTSRGVRALFGGTSGTGKTLAARIIATELGLDLYRVDLSSVVSKYIGETERNLSRLFARAEEQDVILLLDEGDSLLTGRTDVRSSNDRYANMETNYLLQRLEQYEGIILITSNTPSRIDSAFQRRIDVVIDFNPPDAGQRQQLWQLHLPAHHAVSPALLRQASIRCQLTGGQIRNATLHATLLSLEANILLSDTFLAEGIRREYTKMGAVSPLS